MPACKKTAGCVFSIPNDEMGTCRTCWGFGVIVKPDAPNKGSEITCTTCLGTKEVKLIDNKNAQHAGPCAQASDCLCDRSGNVYADPYLFCTIHQRRTLTPIDKARAVAQAALNAPQLAADSAAYATKVAADAAKIDADVAAERWWLVPEPRRSIEMAKLVPADIEVEEIQ